MLRADRIPSFPGAPLLRVGLALLVAATSACDDGAPPPPAPGGLPVAPDPGVLRVAGTGAMTPLASRLASEWARRGGRPPVVVEPSVGSTGGARAAADGVVDLGMVARPLSAAERERGLQLVPVARDAVVVAAHPAVADDSIASSAIAVLLAGGAHRFSDGTAATLLLRDRDDSAHAALERAFPGLREPRERAWDGRRLRVLFHDDAMGEALAETPGALGVFGLGAIVTGRLPLRVLAVDGVRPSSAAVADGAWKATRELAFVARPDRLERAGAFLGFVRSEAGAAIARDGGYVPAAGGAP